MQEHHPNPFGLLSPRICVDLSPRQFERDDLHENVVETLARQDSNPHLLLLEVPEDALINDTEAAVVKLRALKDLGVVITLDSFVGACSVLSRVGSLPADFLNLDRSLIARLEAQPEEAVVVSAVAHLAHRLGWQVIASRAEAAEQTARARELGCDAAQGFYFSEPVAGGELAAKFLTTSAC